MDKKKQTGSCCLNISHHPKIRFTVRFTPCSSYLVMKQTDHTVKTLQTSVATSIFYTACKVHHKFKMFNFKLKYSANTDL